MYMLWRSTTESISACNLSFSNVALAMRSTMRSQLGELNVRVLARGGILGRLSPWLLDGDPS